MKDTEFDDRQPTIADGIRFVSRQAQGPAGPDPELLRRLLRAKDRMDAVSHEAWPIRRLARVSSISEAHFARSFKAACRYSTASLPAHPPHRAGQSDAPRHGDAHSRHRTGDGMEQPGYVRADVPRHHRRKPGRDAAREQPPATRSKRCRTATSAPPTGPLSSPQFRRSGGGRAGDTKAPHLNRRSYESGYWRGWAVRS